MIVKKNLLFLMIIINCFIVIGCGKAQDKNSTASLEPLDQADIASSGDSAIENYDRYEEHPFGEITETWYYDDTGSLNERQMKDMNVEIEQTLDEIFEVVFGFQGEDETFVDSLNAYFADFKQYPNANSIRSGQIYDSFMKYSLVSKYDHENLYEFRVSGTKDGMYSITTCGIANASFSTNQYPYSSYDTMFKAYFLYDNGLCRLFDIELIHIFHEGVRVYWGDSANATLSFEGDHVAAWDIGAPDQISEIE